MEKERKEKKEPIITKLAAASSLLVSEDTASYSCSLPCCFPFYFDTLRMIDAGA